MQRVFPVRGTRSCITILLNVITFPDYEDIIRSVTKHKYPYLLHVWDVVSTKYKGFVRIIEGIRSMIIIRGYNFKNTYEGILLYLTRFNISLTFCRQVCSTAQRDPEPCPPAQPCPYTRRSHHIAHAKDRRIGRHQRPTPRGPTRNIRCRRNLHPAEPSCQPQLN